MLGIVDLGARKFYRSVSRRLREMPFLNNGVEPDGGLVKKLMHKADGLVRKLGMPITLHER